MNGNTVQQQRDITNAVKNAREMALLPYAKRVASVRAGRGERRNEEQAAENTAPEVDAVPAIDDLNIEGVTVETAAEATEA